MTDGTNEAHQRERLAKQGFVVPDRDNEPDDVLDIARSLGASGTFGSLRMSESANLGKDEEIADGGSSRKRGRIDDDAGTAGQGKEGSSSSESPSEASSEVESEGDYGERHDRESYSD